MTDADDGDGDDGDDGAVLPKGGRRGCDRGTCHSPARGLMLMMVMVMMVMMRMLMMF